jgi:anti-anti-sigma factor
MTGFRMEWQDGNHEGERVIKLAGPLTCSAILEFQDEVRKTLPAVTIIDMTDVPYMDSAALGSLLGFHVSCHRNRRKYALIGVADSLQALLTVSGVGGVLVTYASLTEAEGHFYGTGASPGGQVFG